MLSRLADWFGSTKLWKWISSKYVAHVTFRLYGYTKFPIEDYFKIVDLAQPGEFYAFASTDVQSLAAVLIKWVLRKKTYFTHAGLILFEGDRKTLAMHMKGEGLVFQPLLKVLKESDYFAVVKIPLIEGGAETAKDRIQDIIANKEKYEYDFEQKLGNAPNKVYCSELFYRIFCGIVADEGCHIREVLGRDVFEPDAVVETGQLLYSNHPEKKVA